MDRIHNDKRGNQTRDTELWLISLTAFFGIALILFAILSFLGGPSFSESLGGITTLLGLILGMFVFLFLAIRYETKH